LSAFRKRAGILDTDEIAFEERLDGVLVNALTKMGTNQDKERYTGVAAPEILQPADLDALYINNWLCRRIVDIIPQECTRAGWALTLGPETTDAEKKRFDRLVATGEDMGIRTHVKEAMKQSRLHGGAAIIMILDDNTPINEPVNLKRLRAIKGLHAMDCQRIWPAAGWSGVGEPELYQMQINRDEDLRRIGIKDQLLHVPIHRSRLLRFEGDSVPYSYKSHFRWWGVSVLQSVWSVFKRYETGQASAANILNDFSLYVQKVKGLKGMVERGNGDLITNRLALNAMMRSVIGGIALDADGEEASFLTRSAAGVASIIEKLKDEVQGASRIPHTKLWGSSPSGLGATGHSEKADFAQEVHMIQEDHIDRQLRQFYETLAACSTNKAAMKLPEDWQIDFHSTFTLSDLEEAELRGKVATADSQNIQSGVLQPNEVALARFGGAKFSMETTLLDREKNGAIKQDPQNLPPPTFGGDLATLPGEAIGQGQGQGQQQVPRGDSGDERDDGCCSPCDAATARGKPATCNDGAVDGQQQADDQLEGQQAAAAEAIARAIAQGKRRKGRGRRPGVRADGSRVTGRRVVAGVPVDVRIDGSATLVGPYGQGLGLEAAVGFDSTGIWEVLSPAGQWTAVVGVEDQAMVVAAAGPGARVRRLDGIDLLAMGVRCDSYEP
jgi:phage-related protein (TIGR01555 family)